MNILYTCDNNYIWLMVCSMVSLFKSNVNCEEINVYLIGDNISFENIKTLENVSRKYNRKIFIINSPLISIPNNLYSKRWPKSAFFRLYCANILPQDMKKIIYLDCDTIIKENLSDLFDIENKENVFFGVKDCVSEQYRKNIGLDSNDNYINAGVLLINLELLRKYNIEKEISDFINKYEKIISYADQDILNGIFRKKRCVGS